MIITLIITIMIVRMELVTLHAYDLFPFRHDEILLSWLVSLSFTLFTFYIDFCNDIVSVNLHNKNI